MPMKFGKFKGIPIGKVPPSYLKWCMSQDILQGKQLVFAKRLLNYPKDKYKVVVVGSVAEDGIYYVYAHSLDDAIHEMKRLNKIRGTQSHHGTEYTVTQLTYKNK